MTDHMSDHFQISALMTGWMHRDQGEWDQLRDLFHPDGTIEISWFQGLAHDFVEASAGMAASKARTKHVIASPMVQYSEDGLRAFSETNCMIVASNDDLGLGCTSHGRMLDRLEQRDGVWRISHRDVVYDFSFFEFPQGPKDIDQEALSRHPQEYGALAYLLEATGYLVEKAFATQGSAMEQEIKAAGRAWTRREDA